MGNDQNSERLKLVCQLVGGSPDLVAISQQLKGFSWDYNKNDKVELSRDHLVKILRMYVSNELAASDVELWANAIESRDDVCFECGYEENIKDVVFQLANPILNQELDVCHAEMFMALLIA